MTETLRTLVIGDDSRSFLATVRSLGRKGIEVHVAPYDFGAPACSSKYVKKVHRLPYFLNGGAQWLAAIQAIIRDERIALIIPCEERALLPLFKHREELAPLCALAIPDEAALAAFFDKGNTRALATSLNIPVAKGQLLSPADTAASLLQTLELPLVGKWRKSYAWPELYARTSVRVLRSRTDLEQWLQQFSTQAEELFVEEMVPGFGLGLSVLCHEGRILQAFEHHRAHEHQGSSYFRKSAAVHPERLAAVERMVAAVRYTGVAMFEFKHDTTSGRWALLEVNARPWGSLPLPLALGVDFPYRLFQLLVEGRSSPAHDYKHDVYARNLIGDMWQARAQSQSLPKLGMLRHLASWLAGFWRVPLGREHHDAFSWDDPQPALVEIKQLIASRRDIRQGYRQYPPLLSASELPAHLQQLQQDKRRALRISFVCQGNICRSPYAELRARQLFAGEQQVFEFSSAGLLPRNSRPSPPAAQQAAAALGTDLQAHRSQVLDDTQVANVDLLVIFDEINLLALRSRFPNLASRVLLLGSLSGTARSIEDPEGMSVDQFDRIYRRIDACLVELRSTLRAVTQQTIGSAPSA